jgi:hypothetical protein
MNEYRQQRMKKPNRSRMPLHSVGIQMPAQSSSRVRRSAVVRAIAHTVELRPWTRRDAVDPRTNRLPHADSVMSRAQSHRVAPHHFGVA